MAAEHAEHMTLAQLIKSYKGTRSLSELSEAGGGAVSAQRFNAYELRSEWPQTLDKVQAVARALGVSEQTVWMACGTTLGVKIAEEPISLGDLPPQIARIVATLVGALSTELGNELGSRV